MNHLKASEFAVYNSQTITLLWIFFEEKGGINQQDKKKQITNLVKS